MRAYGGSLFRLEGHLARLADSCKGAGIETPLDARDLARWTRAALRASGHPDALLRLSVHAADDGERALVALVRAFRAHPEAWYRDGVALRTATGRRPAPKAQDPLLKTSQFVVGVLATLDALAAPPVHELLFLGAPGNVAEGSVSNVFAVKAKRLLTPPVASGILRGVTRAVTFEAARAARVEVRETPLTRHDLYSADECFMTNTSSEVLPVTALDARAIGAGRPGPVTAALAAAFRRIVRGSLR